MLSIRTAGAIVALATTTLAYGDGAVPTVIAARTADSAAVRCKTPGERLFTAPLYRLESRDTTKPVPMFGYCVDGDGGDDRYVASYVIDAYGSQWQDQCLNSTTQIEDMCGYAGSMVHVSHTCTCVSEWIYVPGWGNRYAAKCQQ